MSTTNFIFLELLVYSTNRTQIYEIDISTHKQLDKFQL